MSAATPTVATSPSKSAGWLAARVLGFGVAVGATGSLAPPSKCAAVAGALVALEAVTGSRAAVPAVRLGLLALAAGCLGPWLAMLPPRDSSLVVGALAWAVLCWRRPGTALVLLIVVAPLHTLLLCILEGRARLDTGSLGMWKELGIGTLLARMIASPECSRGWRAPRSWEPPLVWGVLLTAWVGVMTVAALAAHRVGPGLAVRGLAADLGPLVLIGIAYAGCRARLVDPVRVRAGIVWFAVVLALFGFVQLLWIGPRWYEAVGYFGPRDFKVPGYQHYRLTSVFLDPLPAGLLFAVAALVAFDELVRATRRATRVGLGLTAVLSTCAVLATFTRSAWLGLAVGLVILARIHRREPGVRRALGSVLVASALVSVPLAPRLMAWARDTATGAATDTSSPRHLEAWLRGVRTLADQPSGLGPGRAGEVSVRVLGPAGIVTESSYLQFGVEYGAVGLLLVGCLVVSLTRALDRARQAGGPGAAGALAAWCALAVGGLFLHALTERAVAYPVMILAGAGLASVPYRAPAREDGAAS
jgi:hypothetical protein